MGIIILMFVGIGIVQVCELAGNWPNQRRRRRRGQIRLDAGSDEDRSLVESRSRYDEDRGGNVGFFDLDVED